MSGPSDSRTGDGGAGAPGEILDYFEIFSLPRLASVDTAALERQFYKLSRRWHPDLFATAGAEEQERATQQSSRLNDAYRTLKDPVSRTRHLLRLEGVDLEDEAETERSAARAEGRAREQKVPPDLLAEVFELNMQLEELRAGGHDPVLQAELQRQAASFKSQLAECDLQLRDLWKRWDAAQDSGDETAKSAAKSAMVALLHRRNYIRNLVRDVQAALETKEI